MGRLQLHLTCQTAKPTGTLSRSLYVCLCAFATAPFSGPLLNVSPMPHGYGYDAPLISHRSATCFLTEETQDGPPQKGPWTCQYGFWFKAIQYAWLPKGSTSVGTKNTSMQLNSKPCWIKLQCRWAPHLISVRLCRGSERAQVAVREQPGFQGDGNNVRRAERGKTFLVKLLVSGFTRNLAKFPSGPNFFKSLNLPSFV